MFRIRAMGGASLLVLSSAISCAPMQANAQTVETLPPVSVDAPAAPRSKPAARPSRVRASAIRRPTRQVAANQTPSNSGQIKTVTPGEARDSLYQSPPGQTATTIDRSQFDNRPAFSVA